MTSELEEFEELPTYYHGRKWDAPFTDDAIRMPAEILEALLLQACFCGELMTVGDDIVLTPGMRGHLECHLRSILGDVQHLEGRCMCYRGRGNEEVREGEEDQTYRESAKAALEWLIKNNRGRFHD